MNKELSINDIIRVLWRRAWVIILCSVIGFTVALVGTKLFITPVYSTNALMYVSNKSDTIQSAGNSGSINGGDLSTAQRMVDTYAVILTTNDFLQKVQNLSGVEYSVGQIRGMISVASQNGTEVMNITVKGTDPAQVYKVCQAVTELAPEELVEIMDGGFAKSIQNPVKPTAPVSPNGLRNAMIGAAAGFVLAVLGVLIADMFDTRVKNGKELAERFSLPVLGEIPDFSDGEKGGKRK